MLTRLPIAVALIGFASWNHASAQGDLTKLVSPLSFTVPSAAFGTGVALDGDTLVANATGDDLVFVYERQTAGAWDQVAQLAPSALGAISNCFGCNLSLDGDTLVASNHFQDVAFVFERNAGGANNWGEVKLISGPPSALGEDLGSSVAIHGDTLVLGMRNFGQEEGAALVCLRDLGGPDNWGSAQLLTTDQQFGDYFGESVAVHGDTIAVGSLGGFVHVYERDSGSANSWTLTNQLSGPQGSNFGMAVELDSTRLVVGDGWLEAVHVFERSSPSTTDWTETAVLTASDPGSAGFGSEVALDNALIAVTAAYDDDLAGSAYVFEEVAGTWAERQKFVASSSGDQLLAIALSGDTVATGCWADDTNGQDGGAVYVYESATHAPAQSYCTAGTSTGGCQALLYAFGDPSASASDGFHVYAAGGLELTNGLFFFGSNGRQAAPWGNGSSYNCVVPPVTRSPVMTGSGTPPVFGFNDPCTGRYSLDMNQLWSLNPAKNPGSGAVVQLQLWHRDPQNTSNQSTSLSNALEFTLNP